MNNIKTHCHIQRMLLVPTLPPQQDPILLGIFTKKCLHWRLEVCKHAESQEIVLRIHLQPCQPYLICCDGLALIGCPTTSNMADMVVNEFFKSEFCVLSKNEFDKERDIANTVNIFLQMDLEQNVSEITYISFSLSVPFTLLACLKGGVDVVKKMQFAK